MRNGNTSAHYRSRQVVLWTMGWIVVLQGAAALLPGYPWPAYTRPEVAVQTERYYREGGWTRNVPTLEESIIQWQVRHLLTEVPPQDIVFIGDSSCLMGVIPSRIEQRTGDSAWNLGTVGSLSTKGHARILEMYLKRHASSKPKLVVCVLAQPTLSRTAEEVEESGVLNRFQEWLDGEDAGQSAQAPLAQLPGYRLRRPMYGAFEDLFADRQPVQHVLDAPRGPFFSDTAVCQTLLKNQGYLPEPRRNKLSAQVSDADEMPTDDSLAGIVKMFELARSNSIKMLVLMTPLPESYRTAETVEDFQRLEDELAAAAQPFPNVDLAVPLLRYLADDQFGTPHHLTEGGASRNSDHLAQVIEQTLRR